MEIYNNNNVIINVNVKKSKLSLPNAILRFLSTSLICVKFQSDDILSRSIAACEIEFVLCNYYGNNNNDSNIYKY